MKEHRRDEAVQVGRRLDKRRVHRAHVHEGARGNVDAHAGQHRLEREHGDVDRDERERDQPITVALEEARLAVRHHPFQLVVIDDRPLLRFHRLVHLVWHVFLLERRISHVGTYYHEDRAGR